MILFRSAIVVLIFGEISQCFSFDPVDFRDFESFDNFHSYPMLKVAYYDPIYGPRRVKKGEVRANIIAPGGRSANLRSEEHIDNVRAFEPRSREDIRQMKKLSFHGRSSPRTNEAKSENKSSSHGINPVQLNQQDRKYKEQQANNAAASDEISEELTSERFALKEYDGFKPLMRTSPITVHPVEPEKFMTVRNYVNLLKSRQKDFFADVIEPQEVATEKPRKEPPTRVGDSEVDYFVKRERELVDEQQPRKEHRNLEHVEVVEPIVKEHEFEVLNQNEEESRNHESFVPFRLYAQVRHVESENHRPKSSAPGPRAKEKLSLEKKNVYYKEEGYLEKDYDHGAESVTAKYRHRSKRDSGDSSTLPVAMAYIKKSALPNLTGEKLLNHLDELIKNSSIYLPDEDDDVVLKKRPSETIYGGGKNLKSHKYPYYNLPDSKTLDTMSAFRYSENIKNFPRAKQSLYSFKKLDDCQQIDQIEIDPAPKDSEEGDKGFNKNPQRLKNLGDKIGCYKEKVFGKDPFDNPLFKEKYVAASIPIPLKDTTILAHQANPLITVYDDVISNIRAAFAEELKSKQEKLKEKEEEKPKVKDSLPDSTILSFTKKVKPDLTITRLSSAPSTSRLPIFDINNYYPKLKIPLNDETLIPPVIKDKDYEMEIIDIPIEYKQPKVNNLPNAPQHATALVIKNLRPPNLTHEKRWIRNPITYKVTRSVSIIPSPFQQYFQPPPSKFKLL